MTILDELERLSKEASRGGWVCKEMAYNLFLVKNGEGTICDVATWFYGEQVARHTKANAQFIVLMRNNIDALIQVARAASDLVGTDNIGKTVDIKVAFEGDVSAVFQGKALNALVKALEKLK